MSTHSYNYYGMTLKHARREKTLAASPTYYYNRSVLAGELLVALSCAV